MRIVGTSSNGGSQENVFYSNTNRSISRSGKISFRGRHGSLHSGHHQHEGQAHGGRRGNFRGRGSRRSRGGRGGSHGGQQPNSDSNCYYCGKLGHMAKNCYQREHDAWNGKLQQGNHASTSNQGDEQLFVMQHMVNSMIGGVLDNNVWYVDSRASNHMTSHGEWFIDTKDLKTPGFVETSDDTTHPITQIGKVPLSMQDGQTKYLKDVFHVPTITKKSVFVGQMVEQGLQVTFNPNGCFVENMKNEGKLIAKGERNGRMFTLDVNMPKVNSMLFTHGKGVGDIRIWHKQVGHVNLQRLKLMEKQNLVKGLPKFGTKKVMSEVYEACQLGKQTRHPFPTQISSKPLEMIHSDVWTTKTKSIGGCKYYVSFIDDHTKKVWV